MMLDDKDLKIIEVLKEDSRLSIRNIAKRANLRPSTVHIRIDKLKKKKIIEKFTLKLNNKAIGENFIAFILINTSKDLDNHLIKNRHIKEIFGITGEYDLILKMKFKDVEEFNNFIIKFRKEAFVTKTLTMVATTDLKEEV